MAKSAFFKPTQARPLVRALFDPRSDVRMAVFGALIRLPLAPTDWVQVGTYASWALDMSESTAERDAVIDASPYVPLPSIQGQVARAARESRGEAKSRARDAALKFPDPPTLLAAIRENGSGSDEAAQRLAAADLSQSLDEVRSLVRAVPRNSDVRFWLALGLARFGVDHELKALFEELQQGRHYPFADYYSATLADFSTSTLAHTGWYVVLRNALGVSGCPRRPVDGYPLSPRPARPVRLAA